MKQFKTLVAAAALFAVGAANAAIDQFDGVTQAGNGSLLFLALDSTGATTQGLTIDLGLNYNDFANGGALGGANTKIVWDFNANTITKNGQLVTGVTNDWASERSKFLANSDASETFWTVAAGSQQGTKPIGFLAAGTPDASQLQQQNATVTGGMTKVNLPLIKTPFVTNDNGTINSADNGAYAMGATDKGYVGTAYNLTSVKGWQNQVKWNTWRADGEQTNLWQANAKGDEAVVGDSSKYVLGANEELDTTGTLNGVGTFSYDVAKGQLIWQTAAIKTITPSVPEPESLVLAAVGLAALAVARRRAK